VGEVTMVIPIDIQARRWGDERPQRSGTTLWREAAGTVRGSGAVGQNGSKEMAWIAINMALFTGFNGV